MATSSAARDTRNPDNPAEKSRAVEREPQPARRRSRSLAHDLVEGIGAQIRGQVLKAGDKLPTESEIMQAYGVSRTVVREALSKLQAADLVETRHGIGTFVLEARRSQGFGIDPADIATAVDVMAVLELRVSLETESAGLAAQRRTEAQLKEMRAALDAFEANVDVPGNAVSPDFRFHLAIANATGNRYFADIMTHLGSTVIPRTRIDSSRVAHEDMGQYLRRVHREHEEIFQAIARRDSDSARAAMRIHLTNSRERLRVAQEDAQRQEARQGRAPSAASGKA
ncbi:FadR/GntR family transcriptional regulator [Caenimonas sp. SL110]|uniref:FadR/GntR family transcriptional regulator n=1 Tax=Caenimonas sp. SL110 TaxID=1450524 RepID=UPI0009E1BD20|nr:FadR/GntR family transcriptional regulator [Caenimonas sp. SL110]